LLAFTIVLVAAAGWTLAGGGQPQPPSLQGQRALPELAAALPNLAWIRLTHGKTTTDFNQIGGRWAIVEKGNYPAAQGKVRKLLLALADLTLIEPKTERADRYARLGLDDPSHGNSTQVMLQERSGQTVAELLIGKTRFDWLGGGNDGVYIRKPDDKQSWLARGSLDLPDHASGWLDRKILDIPATHIDKVALTAGDGTVLVLKRDKPGSDFAVSDPPANAKFKDQTALAEPATALSGLDLQDVSPRADVPVPASGATKAVFMTADGLTITVKLFAHDKGDWIVISAKGEGAAAEKATAIDKRLAAWSFAIPTDRARLLRTRLADLLASPKGS
jgi:hypothetical protein